MEILIDQEHCTGCQICQLWCSFINKQLFIPEVAYIQIKDQYGLTPQIIFLDECTQCGQCARHCLYGALSIKGENKIK